MNTKVKAPKKTTLDKLASIAPGVAAQAAALALPYNELARSLATSMAASKVASDTAKTVKTTVWHSFKQSISIAMTNGHDTATLRTGLEIACEEAGIPSGSFRGYVSTIASLHADVDSGALELEQVESISVKDARARYLPEDKAALHALKERLNAAVKELSVEELTTLVEAAEDLVGIERSSGEEGEDASEAQAA